MSYELNRLKKSIDKKKEVSEQCLLRLVAWANNEQINGKLITKINWSNPRYKNRWDAARRWNKQANLEGVSKKITKGAKREIIRAWLAAGGKKIRIQESKIFYNSSSWKKLSKQVIETYGAVCMKCGATKDKGIVICTDHIFPRKKYPLLALEFSNMQVLCRQCNFEKSDIHFTDYR